MFQFLRRVSGSFLPRPDRPWREDATSHAPTIGRKRRHSIIEEDDSGSASSTPKRTKNDSIKPDSECDPASRSESPKGALVDGQDVKEVTKGVKEVDLEDRDKLEDASSIRPEGVPLPESPSGSPGPESGSQDPESEPAKLVDIEETKEQERADDKDSVASSVHEDDAVEGAEAEPVPTNTDAPADESAPTPEVSIAARSGLHDTLETLEVNA